MTTTQVEKTNRLFELIEDIEFGMLVTETADGSLRSRPMAVKTSGSDQNLWLMTDKGSAKLLEISENRKVNVSFSKPGSHQFVSVSGTAAVTDDQSKINELWDSSADVWYPDGASSDQVTLIKVDPEDAEYWCPKSNLFVSMYKLATAAMSGERPEDMGTNEKIEL